MAERALFLWNNEYIVSLIAQNRNQVLPSPNPNPNLSPTHSPSQHPNPNPNLNPLTPNP